MFDSSKINNYSDIFILFINGIGDALLTLPLINYLVELYTEKIIIIAPEDIHSFVYYNINCKKYSISFNRDFKNPFINYQSDIQNLFLQEPKKNNQILISLNAYFPYWKIEDEIRHFYNFDLIYDFKNTNFDRLKIPMLNQYSKILDLKFDIKKYRFITIKSNELNTAKKDCLKIRNKYDKIIAIHTDTTKEKEWIVSNWNDLVLSLFQELNCFILVLGVNHHIKNFSFIKIIKPDWHKQVAYLSVSDIFIGVDSCWAHVADTFNKKGIVLFSQNSDYQIWGPVAKNMHTIVKVELNSISSFDVLNYLKQILN